VFATDCMYLIPGNCTVSEDTYVEECHSFALYGRGETRVWNEAKITTRQTSEVKRHKNKASHKEGTLFPVYTKKLYEQVEVQHNSLLILTLRWSWVVRSVLRALYCWGNGNQEHFQNWSGFFGENSLPLPGIQPHFLGYPACTLVIA
jgi:hypothetical protein